MKKSDIRNILIVDDQPENLQTITDIFTKSQLLYEITQAPNGKIALKIIEKVVPDLIITDWEMPEMDGIEFIKQLKQNTNTVDIPVIMCTGVMTSSKNLETSLQAGAVDYIRKPIDEIELIARTKANLHLADNYTKIKQLNESRNKIFSIIGHDLKGPVGNMKSFLDMILSKEFDFNYEEIVGFLGLLEKQSTATYNILENLLAWANSQLNNTIFNPVKQKINLAVEPNIVLLESIASKKNIGINNKTNDDLIAIFDLNLISTVVRNLIANAIKFTSENGTITINVEQNESQTIVSITDNGIGISTERLETFFKDTSFEITLGTNNEKGSGLGLKLCKEFVEQHNGKIWVESEVEKGSSFIFSIPAKL